MPNRLYNRQVTPKGYQKGGSVKQSPMGSSSTKGNILRGKLKSQKELKKITGSKKYKDASFDEKTKMLNVATMNKGGPVKKPKVRKIMAGGVGKAKDYPGIKEIIKLNKKGKKRFGMKMGGALKPVDPKTQKGLSKLPTKVRNKMGYMKDGGKVKKDYKLGTKFQGDYKDKSLAGKAKEFVKTAAKQTAGTAKQIAKKIRTKKMGGGMMRKRPMMKSGGIAKKGMGCEIR